MRHIIALSLIFYLWITVTAATQTPNVLEWSGDVQFYFILTGIQSIVVWILTQIPKEV